MGIRLAKYISMCGAASRRAGEDLIQRGLVTVNGVVADSPLNFVEEGDVVTLRGREIKHDTTSRLYAFHKPINTMTTVSDPSGRRTIYDCIPMEYRGLKYVGRLDYRTTGLLLLTNDGELARQLTLPSSKIPRVYIATVNFDNTSDLDAVRRGITVDGISYQPMKIDVISRTPHSAVLRVEVCEGKKNEIRIALRAAHAPVRKLHRVSFGPIELKNLPQCKIREVPQKTIDALRKSL